MLLLIFIPIILAIFTFLFKNKLFNKLGFISILIEGLIVYKLFKNVLINGPQSIIIGGYSDLIGINLKLDLISFIFLLVSLVVWLSSFLYSLNKWEKDYKFYFFLHFLRGCFYGLIFSNDLFNIFVFIEIISVISAILIIYKKDGFSIRAAMYYLLFNSVGMIFYLIGLIILYINIGTLNLDYLVNLDLDFTAKLAYGLIVTALGVKSAFFPVYTWTWLPRAHMAAPSSISALLSGVLVKTGFVVLVKLFRVLPEGLFYKYLLIMGILKALSGIGFALSQKSIKGVLAFHTISQSGIILMAIAGGGLMHIGGLFHLINHSLFKSLLFLSVGTIIKYYKTREIYHIKGVFKNLPIVSISLIIGILSITGFPFMNGFVSKTLIKYHLKGNIWLTACMHLINLGTIISFIKVAFILNGKNKLDLEVKKRPSRLPLIILSLITLSAGFIERYILKTYFDKTIYITIKDFLIYGIYVSIGFIIYKYIVKKDVKVMQFLRKYQLGFRRANIILIGFLMITVLFLF